MFFDLGQGPLGTDFSDGHDVAQPQVDGRIRLEFVCIATCSSFLKSQCFAKPVLCLT